MFYDILTRHVKQLLREIDTVTVKGSLFPMKLYTVSMSYENLKIESGF